MRVLENMLWITGAALLALFAGTQTWSEIGRQQDIAAFFEARLPSAGSVSSQVKPANPTAGIKQETTPSAVQSPGESVLAVMRIAEIGLEVPVNYGTDEEVLLRGAGLVEGSALPGSNGNISIAAHRDTHFRSLKELKVGARIELASIDRAQTYVVTQLMIVEPTDVHVLAETGEPVLTLVTCYPFYFVGHAPKRFIVRAVAAEISI